MKGFSQWLVHEYGDTGNFYDSRYGSTSTPTSRATPYKEFPPDQVVGREIKHNQDGTFTIVTKYGDGRKAVRTANNQEEMKQILGLN